VRFNFDGYVKQRLLRPLFIFDYKLFYSTYTESLNVYKKFLFKSIAALYKKEIRTVELLNKLGSFLYLEDVGALKSYSSFFGTPVESYVKTLANFDSRSDFYSRADVNLSKYKNFLFIDVNTRLESPLLNLKLREYFFEEVCSIYSIGIFSSHFDVDGFGGSNLFFRGKILSENLGQQFLFICGYGAELLNNFFVTFLNYLKAAVGDIYIEW